MPKICNTLPRIQLIHKIKLIGDEKRQSKLDYLLICHRQHSPVIHDGGKLNLMDCHLLTNV